MNRRHLYTLVLTLTVVGIGVFLYKVVVMGFPLSPDSTAEIWDLEIRVRFRAHNEPVKIKLYIPRNTPRFVLVDENYVSRGYGLTTLREDGNRQAVWSVRHASGDEALYYRAVVQRIPGTPRVPAESRPAPGPLSLEGARLAAAQSLLADIKAHSADLDTLVAQLMKRFATIQPESDAGLLLGVSPSTARRVEVAVQILALDKVPARLIRGVRLTDHQADAHVVAWLQVHDGALWQSYDPFTGEASLPDDFLILWRGSQPLLEVSGARAATTFLSVRRNQEAGIRAAAERGRLLSPELQAFSMLSLPVKTQEVYRILLLIPVGALLLVVLRNVVGVKTFGTFMPVLIALAFRETQLLAGIVLFILLVSMGLAIRFYLEQLKLLLVPRLAALLIIVVGLMALLSVLSHRLDLETGLSVALFPMVIITMTIERMSIVWDERGAAEAIQQGLGSLGVAALAYLLMSNAYIGHWVFVFPEVLLVILAVTLLLGRYAGYRLLELRRFHALAKIEAGPSS
jgi:hypothetical protein